MKVGVYTLGCKVNAYESEYVISLLKNHNYEIGDFKDVCDIYIINTCTVTNTADCKSRKIINQARRNNQNAVICVMGCFSQLKSDEIKDVADIIIGNKDKSKVVEYIEDFLESHEKRLKIYDMNSQGFESMEITNLENKTRAFVKIQDGCDAFCTYCIIPFVRGNIRSKSDISVIEEIKELVKNGFKEIVLTGIHTGKYGKDINSNLGNLLQKIIKIKGLRRLRISSIEVNEVTDEILSLIETNDIIVDHFHIPLQSGCDKILKLMNRKYTIDYFQEKINTIRSIRPNVCITTDIIVGFPLETEEDFKETIEFVKKIKFTKVHVFPYSKRDKTAAAKLENIVNDVEKKNRVKELINLSEQLEIEYMNNFINKKVEVLIEENKNGYSFGHAANFLAVKIKGEYPKGTLLETIIENVNYPYCICRQINNNDI